MKTGFLFLIGLTLLIGCKSDSKSNESSELDKIEQDATDVSVLSTAEAIANKNGYDNWKDVSTLRFTFNVDRGEGHFERSWTWNPKSNDVTLVSGADTVHFNHKKVDSTTQRADASFINDTYWLLAPFNLVWDEGTTFSEKQNVIAPISKDTLNVLTVVYGNEGGYTPGDAYDFYYSKDFVIEEWGFREGNDSIARLINTWEDYETFKGITISKMHQDSTGGFKLYFSNISIE